jgi:hypothetical protein
MAKVPTRFADNPSLMRGPSARAIPMIEQPGAPDIGKAVTEAGRLAVQAGRGMSSAEESDLENLRQIGEANKFLEEERDRIEETLPASEWNPAIEQAIEDAGMLIDNEESRQRWTNTTGGTARKSVYSKGRGVRARDAIATYNQEADAVGSSFQDVNEPRPDPDELFGNLAYWNQRLGQSLVVQQLDSEQITDAAEKGSLQMVEGFLSRFQNQGEPAIFNGVHILDDPRITDYLSRDQIQDLQERRERNEGKVAANGAANLGASIDLALENGTFSIIPKLAQDATYATLRDRIVKQAGSPATVAVRQISAHIKTTTNNLGKAITPEEVQKLRTLRDTFGADGPVGSVLRANPDDSFLEQDAISDLDNALAIVDTRIRSAETRANQTQVEIEQFQDSNEAVIEGRVPVGSRAAAEIYGGHTKPAKINLFEAGLRNPETVSLNGAGLLFRGFTTGQNLDEAFDAIERISEVALEQDRDPFAFVRELIRGERLRVDATSLIFIDDLLSSPNPAEIRRQMEADPQYRVRRRDAIAYSLLLAQQENAAESKYGMQGGTLAGMIENPQFRGPDGKLIGLDQDPDFFINAGSAPRYSKDGRLVDSDFPYEIDNSLGQDLMRHRLVNTIAQFSRGVQVDPTTLRNAAISARRAFQRDDMALIEIDTVTTIGADIDAETQALIIPGQSIFRDASGGKDGNLIAEFVRVLNSAEENVTPFGGGLYQGTDFRAELSQLYVDPKRDPLSDQATFYLPVRDSDDPAADPRYIKIDIDRSQEEGSRVRMKFTDDITLPREFVPQGETINHVIGNRTFGWNSAIGDDPLEDYPNRFRAYERVARKDYPGASDNFIIDIMQEMILQDGWINIRRTDTA